MMKAFGSCRWWFPGKGIVERDSRNISAAWQNTAEGGFVFYEALIALPILVLLLMSVAAVFMFCMRAYFANLADGELVQEVQMAFSRVVEDALAGQSIEKIGGQREGWVITTRQNLLYRDSQPGKTVKEKYWVHNMASLRKLVRGDVDAPLTGDHTLAQVTIVDFSIVEDEAYPHVYKIRLTGKSEMTKHEYTICTAVYLPPP